MSPRPKKKDTTQAAPTGLDLVWTRPERAKAGRRHSLDRDQVLRAAIELADVEGLEALSIRRIAAKLGASTMALYWYVSSKDDILDLAVDAVSGEDELPLLSGTEWRPGLLQVARQTRALFHRHPWMASLMGSRALLGPNVMRRTNHLLAMLRPFCPDITTTMSLLGTLNAYVTGFVAAELGEMEAQRRSGLTDEAWRSLLGPFVEEHVVASGTYPLLAEYIIEAEHLQPDQEFEFGLGRVLDGIAAYLAAVAQ